MRLFREQVELRDSLLHGVVRVVALPVAFFGMWPLHREARARRVMP